MQTLLMVLEVIVSILLIIVVLLQESKMQGMSGAVSGAAAQAFGGKERGVQGLLKRLTVILGIIFAILSLFLGATMNMF
ncbi:MAG: preprotein translocase subunit SecG [Veillonella sp.]|nr:preprotein translocase subunit SecG [Veillonella sp.]MCF0155846.1 preprotein translocase subunit SecG [Veillonella sp.]